VSGSNARGSSDCHTGIEVFSIILPEVLYDSVQQKGLSCDHVITLNAWWLVCRGPLMQAQTGRVRALIVCQLTSGWNSDSAYTRCVVVFCSVSPVPAFPVKKTFLPSFTRFSTCCCKYILRLSFTSDTLARGDGRNRRHGVYGQSGACLLR